MRTGAVLLGFAILHWPDGDLRSAGREDLHYRLFLGDVEFRVGASDFSVSVLPKRSSA